MQSVWQRTTRKIRNIDGVVVAVRRLWTGENRLTGKSWPNHGLQKFGFEFHLRLSRSASSGWSVNQPIMLALVPTKELRKVKTLTCPTALFFLYATSWSIMSVSTYHVTDYDWLCGGGVTPTITLLLATPCWRDPTRSTGTAVHGCNSWLAVWTQSCRCPV